MAAPQSLHPADLARLAEALAAVLAAAWRARQQQRADTDTRPEDQSA